MHERLDPSERGAGGGQPAGTRGARGREARVRTLIEPVIARESLELVDVELTTEQGRLILRLYIDTVPPGTKEAGVTLEHCQLVSRVVGDLLDVEDAIPQRYSLEVSSPGLFRPLTKPEHFARALGERVKLKTYDKIDGRRVFVGALRAHDAEQVVVDVDGQPATIPVSAIAKANLEPLL